MRSRCMCRFPKCVTLSTSEAEQSMSLLVMLVHVTLGKGMSRCRTTLAASGVENHIDVTRACPSRRHYCSSCSFWALAFDLFAIRHWMIPVFPIGWISHKSTCFKVLTLLRGCANSRQMEVWIRGVSQRKYPIYSSRWL